MPFSFARVLASAILPCAILPCAILLSVADCPKCSGELKRIRYNQPDLAVDLGVGLWAWPIPIDYDRDGDLDLVVVCPDKPHNGAYFFENPGGSKMPVFRPGKRISAGYHDVQVSYHQDRERILTAGHEYPSFRKQGLSVRRKLPVPAKTHKPPKFNIRGTRVKVRARQWKYADYDGDSKLDLIIGIGDWTEYGWDDAYDSKGKWKNGPLHGYLYLRRNLGTEAAPKYAAPRLIKAGGKPIDVYGRPSPNLADFDGDGDLDILCGEFVDKFTYFRNVGSRTTPVYEKGRYLQHKGRPLRMELCMIAPVAIDWDRDGDLDLVVGDEDGRVALVENTGEFDQSVPRFLPPRYFQQEADAVKFGALATPVGFDWDGDGDEDILCGNTAGYIAFIENLGGQGKAKWQAPVRLKGGGRTIRIQAGSNGSIQGPCEEKWGYTTLSVNDWDHDGLPDLIVNSIWGKVVWYRNIGSRSKPRLAAAQTVQVEWPGKPPKPAWNWWDPQDKDLVSQWRTTPVVVDFNGDRLNDLVMLDHEGYLAFFERQRRGKSLVLMPGQRIFIDKKGKPLRFNARRAGGSGRRKFCITDWDGDGRLDLLANSMNADWWRNVETRQGKIVLVNMGQLDTDQLGGHTSSPTVVDWNKDGIPELLIGAEDGFLYHAKHRKPLK